MTLGETLLLPGNKQKHYISLKNTHPEYSAEQNRIFAPISFLSWLLEVIWVFVTWETEATVSLVHVCSYHSLHLCLSPILPISANPALFISATVQPVQQLGLPSLLDSFHIFHFYTVSLCLMERRGEDRHHSSIRGVCCLSGYSF